MEELWREGECVLLSVELDRQPGEETPRVTIRQAHALGQVASAARMELWVDVTTAAAVTALGALLASSRGGRSEAYLRCRTPGGGTASVFLGDDFALDAELVDAITQIPDLAINRFETVPTNRDGYRARYRRSQMHLVEGMRATG
jgi:DNA polymerase-3 subunit alpha